MIPMFPILAIAEDLAISLSFPCFFKFNKLPGINTSNSSDLISVSCNLQNSNK